MTGSTAFAAFSDYARPISAALYCVTHTRLNHIFPHINTESIMRFKERHITLRRGRGTTSLLLRFNQSFGIQHSPTGIAGQQYRVNALSWDYSIYDHNERDILAYHWHPEGVSGKTAPHFHVGSVILDTTGHELGKTFSKLHLPSG